MRKVSEHGERTPDPVTQIWKCPEATASPLTSVFASRMPTSACVKDLVPAYVVTEKVAEPLKASS